MSSSFSYSSRDDAERTLANFKLLGFEGYILTLNATRFEVRVWSLP